MMREILFRGKHVHALPKNEHLNGIWIEGYLSDEKHINSPELDGEFLVNENTVCQYIGLKDKNDRKIFEGDIIRYKKQVFRVGWLEGCAQYAAHPARRIGWSPCLNVGTVKYAEVIGNVFDSPGLLGGENE